MKRFAIIVAAAAAVLALLAGATTVLLSSSHPSATVSSTPASALAQSMSVPPTGTSPLNGISVTGEGTVTVQPDLAKVTLGVQVTNASAAAAQQDAASKMDSVVASLKQAGISDKDIQTVRFDLSPDYQYDNNTRTQVLKGYRVTNLVVATVRDISKVGQILDSAVTSGATMLQGVSFSVSDPAAAGRQGREQAMKDASAKAQQLASLAGVGLGSPISIEETVSAPPTPAQMQSAAAPMAASAAQTPISPGTQEIRTVVRVVYAIK